MRLTSAWVLLLLAPSLVGCATIPLDQSYRALDSPFEGDSSFVSSITGPLFDDYSLVNSPAVVHRVSLNQDGTLVASKQDRVTLWNVEDGTAVGSFEGVEGGPWAQWFAFDERERRFVITFHDRVELYQVDEGMELELAQSWALPGRYQQVEGCMSGRALWLALRERYGDEATTFFAPRTGEVVRAQTTGNDMSFGDQCSATLTQAEMSPDGRAPLTRAPGGDLIASSVEHWGGFNASPTELILLDTQSGRRCASLSGHRDSIHAIAFSGDGSFVASGSRDQSVRVWRVPSDCRRHPLKQH
jgi:WD40 repeat protein